MLPGRGKAREEEQEEGEEVGVDEDEGGSERFQNRNDAVAGAGG